MSSVSIQLLGGFFVVVDGERTGVDGFTRRGGAELVQLLALTPGRRLHREQVFDALWPEVDPEKAVGILYRSATAARKVLGSSSTLTLAGESVALLPDDEPEIDIELIASADPDDPAQVSEAIAAYSGDLLPEALYAEWTVNRREQVRQTYLDLLARAGRWRTLLEVDPTHEEAHLALMREALDQGDRQGVLRRFELLERTMLDELGIEPSPMAKALRDEAETVAPTADGPLTAGLRAVMATRWEGADGAVDGARTQEILSETVEGFGGSVVEPDHDGLQVIFPSTVSAFEAAVACQRVVQATNWGDGSRPLLRVGVDIGEAERRTDGWSGQVLLRAAAIGEAAATDQIVCSASAAELAGRNLDSRIRLVELGLYRLPDLPPVSLHRVSAEGIEDRPKPLRAGRLTGRPVSTEDEATFGRDAEIELLTAHLRKDRLITVVGPGGAGKTHLAEHVASKLSDDYPGGAWMAALGSVVNAADLESEVLAAIGGHRHTDTTVVESIIRTIDDQATLLVVDNCEHLIEPVAHLVRVILDRCPGAHILATSREPIGIRNEVLQPIGQLSREASIALFEAEAARRGFEVDSEDPALDRICGRLDDLPLAIRLAAARTRTLGLDEVEALLADRLDVLRSPDHPELAHHATLRAAIAWSVDALPVGPRTVMADLAVFADRFTLEGVIAIAGRDGVGRGEILDHFDELVRRSLVTGPIRTDGEARYRLLESVRLYAGELIEDDSAADRHLAYVQERAERFDLMMRDEANQAVQGFRSDWEDLRRARSHAADSGQIDRLTGLLGAVAGYAIEFLPFEFLDWYEAAFSLDDGEISGRNHARALSAAALMVGYRGDIGRALNIARRAKESVDYDDVVLYVYGWSQSGTFDGDHGRASFEAVLTDPDQTAGHMRCAALSLLCHIDEVEGGDSLGHVHRLGVLAANGGDIYQAAYQDAAAARLMDRDPENSIRGFEESVSIADRLGHRPLALAGRSGLASVTSKHGTVHQALEACLDSLTWPRDSGILTSMPYNLARMARVLVRADRPDTATTLLAVSNDLEAVGTADDGRAELVEELRSDNPEHFDLWWQSGTGLDVLAAINLAETVTKELTKS